VNGVMGKLLQIILERRNITYEVFRSDANLGIPLKNGSWTGMSGYLQRNEADIMLGPPLMSLSRTKIMDFSAPLMFDQHSILSHYTETKVPDLLQYLKCFDWLIWMFIILSLLFSLLIFIMSDRISSESFTFKSISHYLILIIQMSVARSKKTIKTIYNQIRN